MPLTQKGLQNESKRANPIAFSSLSKREFHAPNSEKATVNCPAAFQSQKVFPEAGKAGLRADTVSLRPRSNQAQMSGSFCRTISSEFGWRPSPGVALMDDDLQGGRWTKDWCGGARRGACVCLDASGRSTRALGGFARRRTGSDPSAP